MSLYYDAATLLTSNPHGSLKSLIYSKTSTLKSKPAHLYALISETSKYDAFLKEVLDNADILAHEPKLTPLLALLIAHDHFFARGGIAAGKEHVLRQAVERHRARLQAEFTKARLKRRVVTVETLKAKILEEKGIVARLKPRWVRVNTLVTTLDELVLRGFSGYESVESLERVVAAGRNERVFYRDSHVPNLLAFPPELDLTKHPAYLNGEIILQDKASCFPAYLLLGKDIGEGTVGDVIDGCAAPGNKTTHSAALMGQTKKRVFACERDAVRSKTLQMMVDKAGAGRIVTVLQRQDFLALDVNDSRFGDVTHLLLDPSCSGSGILGREDIPELALPEDPKKKKGGSQQGSHNTKKRKRGDERQPSKDNHTTPNLEAETEDVGADAEETPVEVTKSRLEKLSNLQSRIVEHALSFPAARMVTYSTCSIHVEENEAVVARVLNSSIAQSRGWRILKRNEQVHGMQMWTHRGVSGNHGLSDEQREACIRCTPDDGEGTMGFFVCGFIRNKEEDEKLEAGLSNGAVEHPDANEEVKDDWEGFSDT